MPITTPTPRQPEQDPYYHPLHPDRNARVTPLEHLRRPNMEAYRSTYWTDFKQTLGFNRPSGTPAGQAYAEQRAAGSLVERTMSGLAGMVRGLTYFGTYGLGATTGGLLGGLAAGTGIDVGFGQAWNASGLGSLRERFETRSFVRDIGQVVAKGTGETLTGHGFGREDVRSVTNFLEDAAKREGSSIDEIKRQVVEYTNQGLMGGTQTAEEFKRQFGKLKANVKELVELLGTTQDETLKMLSEFNRHGIQPGQVRAGAKVADVMSRQTGLPMEHFMQSGLRTAQSFQGTGINAGAGFQLGIANRGLVAAGVQSGAINKNTLWQYGGQENAAFALTQSQAAFLNRPEGNLLLRAAMGPNGLDPARLAQLSQQGFGAQLDSAVRNMRAGGYLEFLGREDQMRSQFLGQGTGYVEAARLQAMINAAQTAGAPIRDAQGQLDINRLRGFATKREFDFDLSAGALQAYQQTQTTMADEVQRRQYQDQMRAFVRRGRFFPSAGRGIGGLVQDITGAVVDPLARFQRGVFAGAENTSQRFEDWWERTRYGVIRTRATDNDLQSLVRSLAEGGSLVGAVPNLQTGVFRDLSRSVDTGEMAIGMLEQGLFTQDVQSMSVSDLWGSRRTQQLLRDRGILQDEVVRYQGIGSPGANEALAATISDADKMGILKDLYPDAAFLEDRPGLLIGSTDRRVVMNPMKMWNEQARINQSNRLAVSWGNQKKSERRKVLNKVDSIGGKPLYEISQRLKNLDYDQRAHFNDLGDPGKVAEVFRMTGVSRERLVNSDQARQGMSALLTLMSGEGLNIDTKALQEYELNVNLDRVKLYQQTQQQNVKHFIDGIGGEVIEPLNGGGSFRYSWSLSGDMKRYFRKRGAQENMAEWVSAQEHLGQLQASGASKEKIGQAKTAITRAENKLKADAPSEVQEEMRKLLGTKQSQQFYEDLRGYFGHGAAHPTDQVRSQYEGDVARTKGPQILKQAFESFRYSENAALQAFGSQSGAQLLADVSGSGGLSVEDVLSGMGTTRGMASRRATDGWTTAERSGTLQHLLTYGSRAEQLLAYASINAEGRKNLDEGVRQRFKSNVLDAITATGMASRKDLENMTESQLRQVAATTAVAYKDTGDQWRFGAPSMRSARSAEAYDVNAQLNLTLLQLTGVLHSLDEAVSTMKK